MYITSFKTLVALGKTKTMKTKKIIKGKITSGNFFVFKLLFSFRSTCVLHMWWSYPNGYHSYPVKQLPMLDGAVV